MRTFGFVTIGILLVSAPAASLAASQPITIYPGQTLSACARNTVPPATPGLVCTRNVVVSGGSPHSGYSFHVKSGTTLPPGVFLITATGVLTATSRNAPLPTSGKKIIHLTVSDGSKTADGTVVLQMETAGSVCGCEGFAGDSGWLGDALANQPYAVALPVTGPSSYDVLRPVYTWKASGKLPTGLVLDRARGVLRGTPASSTSGHTYTFTVNIAEKHTSYAAHVLGPYMLHVR